MPTAIVFLDDYSARMTMQAAVRAKVRVPEDLSMIGMNNDTLSVYAMAPLTTVDFPNEKMGAAAVDLATSRAVWGASPEEPAVRKVFPVKLLERESTTKPGRS